MFGSNPFLKKDPLVEAVRKAQQDGDIRRQAEALVNEEFGVYSRKAVVRENLAAYDAALEEAYKCMKEDDYSSMKTRSGNTIPEAKKLAKKDYDKDGKVESPKDEVWGSRLRAAKQAGKLKEEEQLDEIADTHRGKKALASYIKKAHVSGLQAASKGEIAYANKDKAGLHAANKTGEKREQGIRRAANKLAKEEAELDEAKGTAAVQNLKHRDFKEGRHPNPGAVTKAPVPGVSIAEGVSRKHFQQVADLIKSHDSQEKRNELASHHAGIFSKQNPRFDHARFHKAAGSTAYEAPEAKKMDEAAYSAKAARAGKDIGKPGKMFSKIASKAGEKYGSEERGKKVAGAILAKIRAKHMKEDSSFNAAQETGKSVAEQMAFDNSFNQRLKMSSARKVMGAEKAAAQPVKGSNINFATPQQAKQNMARPTGAAVVTPPPDTGSSSAPRPAAASASASKSMSSVPLPPTTRSGAAPVMAKVTAPKPAAASATPAASATASSSDTYSDGRNKSAFDAAFNKAREIGGAAARFKFGDKEYQAAKTSDEYVSRGKQKEVDIGDLSKNVAQAASTSDNATPADTTPKSDASASATTPSSYSKTKEAGAPKTVAESVQIGDYKYRIV